ncbi:hypothetical protein TNCV_3212491 [Trichonephila clavipes]|nr:hypothetical protein TNCV_3212491 [Trichonephila clavipes]
MVQRELWRKYHVNALTSKNLRRWYKQSTKLDVCIKAKVQGYQVDDLSVCRAYRDRPELTVEWLSPHVQQRGIHRSTSSKKSLQTVWHEDKVNKFASSLRVYRGVKLVETVIPGRQMGPYPVRHEIELWLNIRNGQLIPCCFQSMPHIISRISWRMVARQFLRNSKSDALNGRQIWRSRRLVQNGIPVHRGRSEQDMEQWACSILLVEVVRQALKIGCNHWM